MYVGLKRTRSSNTDRSRRGRAAGLEWQFCFSGSALEKANPLRKGRTLGLLETVDNM
jgi:hypothetical protein